MSQLSSGSLGEVFWAVDVMQNGRRILDGGNLRTGRQWAPTGSNPRNELLELAAGATVRLWAYSTSNPLFSLALIQPDARVYVAAKFDKPTSTTDATPLGTHVVWNTMTGELHQPVMVGMYGPCNPLPADHAREINGTAGSLADAESVEGRCYAIDVKNPNAFATRVRVLMVG